MVEPFKEVITQEMGKSKTPSMTSNPEKQTMVMPEVARVPRFVQERPYPIFPQRIIKEKEE